MPSTRAVQRPAENVPWGPLSPVTRAPGPPAGESESQGTGYRLPRLDQRTSPLRPTLLFATQASSRPSSIFLRALQYSSGGSSALHGAGELINIVRQVKIRYGTRCRQPFVWFPPVLNSYRILNIEICILALCLG